MAVYLGHVIQMVRQILFSRFSYSRTKLLKSYLMLLAESIRFHLSDQRTQEAEEVCTTRAIFGYRIDFMNYGQLLDMFEEIFILKAYQPVGRENSGIIVDGGANIGLSILYFRLISPASQIIAFEPHLPTFKILGENIANNGLTGIQIHQRALSDRTGVTTLYGDRRFTLNMSLDKDYAGYDKTFQQETRTEMLSDFVNEPTFVVKLDVEGSELKIVENLIANDKLRQVQNLIIEYHSEVGLEEFKERVCAFGFQSRVRKKSVKSKEALLYFWK
jgi:FkbM family methyltransferase